MNQCSELDLLRSFARERTDACFGEILRRHLDLVYSAAVRLVLDPHLAQDVSQAVFLALAEQASTVADKLAKGATLSGWLHVTTRNIAAKLVRTEVRRRVREQQAVAMNESSSEELPPDWDRIAPHLDHALGDLAAGDRDALLLRFFECKSAREIGQQLGLNEEAAQKRVTRALDRLRGRLLARGAFPSAAAGSVALAAMLAAHSVQAAPATVPAVITKAALLASSLSTANATATLWSWKTLHLLAMNKSQIAVLVTLTTAFVIPFGIQQASLNALEASLATSPIPRSGTPAPPAVNVTRESEAEETARLRQHAEVLRQQLALSKARAAVPPESLPGGPSPATMALGKRRPISELEFAGNASPEAALESLLAFRRDGDVEGAISLMLLAPEKVPEWRGFLASAQERERIAQEMVAATTRVGMRPNLSLDETGKTSELFSTEFSPDRPTGMTTAEIIDIIKLDERRVQIALRMIGVMGETQVDYHLFGLTRSGWKAMD